MTERQVEHCVEDNQRKVLIDPKTRVDHPRFAEEEEEGNNQHHWRHHPLREEPEPEVASARVNRARL